jgi:hypothetical protein
MSEAGAHCEPSLLSRFADGELPPPRRREVLAHLLDGCGDCGRQLRERITPSRWGTRMTPLDGAGLARAAERARSLAERARADREAADRLLGEIEETPFAAALERARRDPRLVSTGLCERLAAMSYDLKFADPNRARELAELAVAVGERLPGEDRRGRDAAARAWLELANARRKIPDLVAAEQALARAEEHRDQGTGDPLLAAKAADVKAVVRGVAGRFDDAVSSSQRAVAIYRRLRDAHREGVALIELGAYLGMAGQLDRGIATIRRGLGKIDQARDPRMALGARHNLALLLHEAGANGQAAAELAAIRPLWVALGSEEHLLDARWLEGKILAALGRVGEAEAALVETRDALLERENVLDAALVSLELAALHLEAGRTGEVRALAPTLLAYFRGHRIGREALAALRLFAEAAQSDRLTLAVLADVVSALERVRSGQQPR